MKRIVKQLTTFALAVLAGEGRACCWSSLVSYCCRWQAGSLAHVYDSIGMIPVNVECLVRFERNRASPDRLQNLSWPSKPNGGSSIPEDPILLGSIVTRAETMTLL